MSEDKVPYGNPKKDIFTLEMDGGCQEHRLFDTAQKILLSNITNRTYLDKATGFAKLCKEATQQDLDECFGYPVDREQICDEFVVNQAINMAKLFVRRYEQLK